MAEEFNSALWQRYDSDKLELLIDALKTKSAVELREAGKRWGLVSGEESIVQILLIALLKKPLPQEDEDDLYNQMKALSSLLTLFFSHNYGVYKELSNKYCHDRYFYVHNFKY